MRSITSPPQYAKTTLADGRCGRTTITPIGGQAVRLEISRFALFGQVGVVVGITAGFGFAGSRFARIAC